MYRDTPVVDRETVQLAMNWADAKVDEFNDRSGDDYSESKAMKLRRLQASAIAEQAMVPFAQSFNYDDSSIFNIPFDYSSGSDGGHDLPKFEDGTKVDVKSCFSNDAVFAIEKSTVKSKDDDDLFVFAEIQSRDWYGTGTSRSPLARATPVHVKIMNFLPVDQILEGEPVRSYEQGETVCTQDGRELFEMKWNQGGYVFDKSALDGINQTRADWRNAIMDGWYEIAKLERERSLESGDAYFWE